MIRLIFVGISGLVEMDYQKILLDLKGKGAKKLLVQMQHQLQMIKLLFVIETQSTIAIKTLR